MVLTIQLGLSTHHVSCGQIQVGCFSEVDLQPCKTMTDTLAPVECANWVLSAWNSTLDQNDVPSVLSIAISWAKNMNLNFCVN